MNDDVNMEDIDKKYEDFDFAQPKNVPKQETSQLNRLVNRIEEVSRS